MVTKNVEERLLENKQNQGNLFIIMENTSKYYTLRTNFTV